MKANRVSLDGFAKKREGRQAEQTQFVFGGRALRKQFLRLSTTLNFILNPNAIEKCCLYWPDGPVSLRCVLSDLQQPRW